MKHIKFTYNRNFRIKPRAIELSELQRAHAHQQFKDTGLYASEWLCWFAQYTDEYVKATTPSCAKCGGSIKHSEGLIHRGNHGSDPLAQHIIECQDCSKVYADYTGYPGVTLDAIQQYVGDN
jgi:hypothetical protein